jgi:ribosomal protein S18 acetylase RimI-like enzyme
VAGNDDETPRGAGQLIRSSPADIEPLAALLARAFADDPIQSWLFPDRRKRVARLEHFYRLDLRHRLLGPAAALVLPAAGSLPVGAAGAAFWMPPDTWRIRWRQALAIAPAFMSLVGPRGVRALRFLDAIERAHPTEPHWYLAHLGVHPAAQGRGLGARLVGAGLDLADASGSPAYLECSSQTNVAFYHRFGFREIERIERANTPPVTLMWRDASR